LLRWAGSRPLLLVFGDGAGSLSVRQTATLHALTSASNVCAVQVAAKRAHIQAREAVLDPQYMLLQACGLEAAASRHAAQPCRWALLRPDSYLAARGSQLGASLVHAIARCAGTTLQGDSA
jgi:3-(3-hydroxy-phenyl)propionate hydroxylase